MPVYAPLIRIGIEIRLKQAAGLMFLRECGPKHFVFHLRHYGILHGALHGDGRF